VQPHSTHLGGDAFCIVRTAAGETVALNAGGRAPLAATPDRFPDGIPQRGAAAVAVPGLVDAWCALQDRFATKDFGELLAPAAEIARDGFVVTQQFANAATFHLDALAADPGCAAAFLSDGAPPKPGALLRQPDVGSTLEAIGNGGRSSFYSGEIGGRIADFIHESGGLVSIYDLAGDTAMWEEPPLITTYRGCTVFEQPLPSQGFVTLEALNIIEGFDLAQHTLTSPEAVHPMVEAVRLAFDDRYRHAGDPDAVDVPIDRLLSMDHAAELRARIDPQRALPAAVLAGPGDTTSFAVADGDGNVVTFIQSVFAPWGAAVLVPGTGVLLNNRLTGFSLDPASPNVLRPGMRTMHTLNTWLLDTPDGRTYAGGAPGAAYQVQLNLQTIAGIVDWRLDPQRAIDAPKWGIDGTDVGLEGRFPAETSAGLESRGHAVRRLPSWFVLIHRGQAVGRLTDGTLLAASASGSEGAALAL
jgi:gamma-glutamyltranspeptidase/glutathione hydrolase